MPHRVLNDEALHLFNTLSTSSDNTYFFASKISIDTSLWSESAVSYFGLPSQVLHPAADTWASLIHPEDLSIFQKDYMNMVENHTGHHDCEYRIRNAAGEYVWVNCKGTMTYDENGNPDFFTGFIVNMGKINKIDPVTNLWTVFEFRNDLDKELSSLSQGMVLLISINSFKTVNDRYGHNFGDRTLYVIGQLLMNAFSSDCTVYRMEGAEFALILKHATREDAQKAAITIQQLFDTLTVKAISVPLSFRSVATEYPIDGVTADQIQNNLYYALNTAKENKEKDLLFFSSEIYLKRDYRNRLQNSLKKSIDSDFNGFRLVLQPIIDSTTQKCVSGEFLLRWSHPTFPKVSPSDFVPILEETQWILPVGQWIIDQALSFYAEYYHNPHDEDVLKTIHVNISYLQFLDDSLLDYVVNALDARHLPHNILVLELTESCRVDETTTLAEILQRFKDAGIGVALDDFGTGYASLNVLKDIPADIVKIDHTLIRTIVNRPKDRTLIEFIITYCIKADITVCTEGVETDEILDIVTESGAALIQGYYYDQPLELISFKEKYLED